MNHRYILSLLILFPSLCFAKSFIAKVDSNEISTNDRVILTLTISDAKIKSEPDVEALFDSFDVVGKQTFSSMQMVQWKKSITVSWQYTLIPKKHGSITIPKFNIETTTGLLSTDPITISVTPATKTTTKTEKSTTSPVVMNINIVKPIERFYIGQPIIFDLEMYETKSTTNLQLDTSKSSMYSIEQVDGPNTIVKSDDNGQQRQVTRIRYSMNINEAGTITFPIFTINGYEVSSSPSSFNDPFQAFNSRSFFDQHFDDLKPFTASTQVFDINVSDYESRSRDLWLPAEQIEITDSVENNIEIKQGDPITRSITITGKGAFANNIPQTPLFTANENYKVYFDKPVQEQEYAYGNIIAKVTHSYTIIPTTPGEFSMPEISIPWWSTIEHKEMVSNIKPLKMSILAVTSPIEPTTQDATPIANKLNGRNDELSLTQILLSVILISILILINLVLYLIFRRPKDRMNIGVNIPKTSLELDSIANVKQLAIYLQVYFTNHYSIEPNTAIDLIPGKLSEHYYNTDELKQLINDINAAMFNNHEYNINELKSRADSAIQKICPQSNTERDIKLNPC
jgi:hypothetical protein